MPKINWEMVTVAIKWTLFNSIIHFISSSMWIENSRRFCLDMTIRISSSSMNTLRHRNFHTSISNISTSTILSRNWCSRQQIKRQICLISAWWSPSLNRFGWSNKFASSRKEMAKVLKIKLMKKFSLIHCKHWNCVNLVTPKNNLKMTTNCSHQLTLRLIHWCRWLQTCSKN